MAYNPTTIANYFITTYGTIHAPLSIDKLVCLTYFSYGWYLAFSEGKSTLIKEPLICKRNEATFGSLFENMVDSWVDYYYKKLPNPQGNQSISKEDVRLLDRVWNTYGHLPRLRGIAFYNGDTPWKQTVVTGRLIIPMHLVYAYFKNMLIKSGTNAA
ncbi:hypothetical protein [Chitinophaga sancti]|uniref:hypothetical protein n=1 Tax=Chitinophaga sancti TaxID=1004 RepID=UPI003F78CA53